MLLESWWYTIMMYCYLLQDLMWERPKSSEYNLLMVSSMTWSSYVGVPSSLMVMLSYVLYSRGLFGLIGTLGGLGFVDRTPCWLCVMWPLMVSADSRKYLDVLA